MTGWRKRTIMEMAKEVGMRYREIEDEFFSSYADGVYLDELEAFAKLVREDEREACAKLCDELANDENTDEYINAADWCAVRIRARGQA